MPSVFYFGGYKADSGDVESWGLSATHKLPGSEGNVITFPYPVDATAGEPLEVWQGSDYVATYIEKAAERGLVYIVGHSSGCAIANDVADYVLGRGCDEFCLIALDGFCPNRKLLDLPGTKVWSARCGGVFSLNYHSLQQQAGSKFHIYAAEVREKWPLHFSLVNLNANDGYPLINDGYYHCDANLEVLGL